MTTVAYSTRTPIDYPTPYSVWNNGLWNQFKAQKITIPGSGLMRLIDMRSCFNDQSGLQAGRHSIALYDVSKNKIAASGELYDSNNAWTNDVTTISTPQPVLTAGDTCWAACSHNQGSNGYAYTAVNTTSNVDTVGGNYDFHTGNWPTNLSSYCGSVFQSAAIILYGTVEYCLTNTATLTVTQAPSLDVKKGFGKILNFTQKVSSNETGNALISRTQPSDGATNGLVTNGHAPLTAGLLTGFKTFSQTGGPGTFNAYILRPTGQPNEYRVVRDSGACSPTGDNQIHLWPVQPVQVLDGDILAHYGWGIPYDGAGAGSDHLHWPSGVAPVLDEVLTLGGGKYPYFSDNRLYSIQAVVEKPVGLVKQIRKILGFTLASVATLSSILGRTYQIIVSAIAASTVGFGKLLMKVFNITQASTLGMKKDFSKILSLTSSITPGVIKGFSKTFSIAANTIPVVTKGFFKSLSFTVGSMLVLMAYPVKRYFTTISVTATSAATTAKVKIKTVLNNWFGIEV